MKEIIELKSRDYEGNYLKRLPKSDRFESKTYSLKVSTPTLRVGNTEEGNKFIYPTGGPMIIVGSKLEEANALVKSIDFIEGYGWTITFQ